MIICPKCGNDNPLGRVFCGKCGGKLDFSHTSSQDMVVKPESNWFRTHWPKLAYLVVLIVLIPVALVLWPQPPLVGKPGTGGETRVENGVRAVSAVKPGQIVNATFAEEDLNGYLQLIKAKDPGADSLSISLRTDYFVVRMVHPLFTLPVIKIKGQPVVAKLSYDITCVPYVSGGSVNVTKASMGHIPAIGPFKTKAAKAVYGAALRDKDWAPFANITGIKVTEGRITVTIKP